jgi:hypothetical protein
MMAINNQRLKVVSQSFQKYTEREGNIVRGTLEVKIALFWIILTNFKLVRKHDGRVSDYPAQFYQIGCTQGRSMRRKTLIALYKERITSCDGKGWEL